MTHTITAIFQTADIAQAVQRDIAAIGVPDRYITTIGGADRADDIDVLNLPHDEATTYRQAVRQGHHIVSAEAEDAQIDAVVEIMRHPEQGVDIDAYETDYRASPDYVAGADVEGEQTIQLAEEQLTVGKRTVEKGSAHVRTYVQEVPVEERGRLHEERLSIERRPVGKVVTGAEAEGLFQERDIEATTRSEEAVVGKEAVVTEEVVIGREVTEREEVVHDTVRKTEVEVDEDRT